MSTYSMRKKNTFNDMEPLLLMCIQYCYKCILYRSALPLRKTIWLRMVCQGYTLLYTSKVVQASTHTINKFSPLIIYLGFVAITMTRRKLIKNSSYRQSCNIFDWFGLLSFSERMNPDKKMVVAIHLRGRAKL